MISLLISLFNCLLVVITYKGDVWRIVGEKVSLDAYYGYCDYKSICDG